MAEVRGTPSVEKRFQKDPQLVNQAKISILTKINKSTLFIATPFWFSLVGRESLVFMLVP